MHTGGWADKLGNRYEGRWAAKQLLLLLAEKLQTVQLETEDAVEQRVDLLVVHTDGIAEAQQCKKNNSLNNWTIAELARRGVLAGLYSFLTQAPARRYSFISNREAIDLKRLIEKAREASGDFADFHKRLGSHDLCSWEKLCRELHFSTEADGAFRLLVRTEVVGFDDGTAGQAEVEDRAELLLDGNPRSAVLRLADFALERMGHPIYADDLRRFLHAQTEFRIRDLTYSPRIAATIEARQDEFSDSIRRTLIQRKLFPRPEAVQLHAAITGAKGTRIHCVHGVGGQGKSCVLHELTHLLSRDGIPFLPLRFDVNPPRGNTRAYGQLLEFPESPVKCLHAVAGSRTGVLLIDQLDALRWTPQHDPSAWFVFERLVTEALQLSTTLHVVFACRTFDLENDPQIRPWSEQEGIRSLLGRVPVGDLPGCYVQEVVDQAGGSWDKLNPGQRRLLERPQCLYLWTNLPDEARTAFRTATDLMRAFWRDVRLRLERTGLATADVEGAVGALVSRLDDDGASTAPVTTLDRWPTVRGALASLHVIEETQGNRIRFAHQSYFDYYLAELLRTRLRQKGASITAWLTAMDEQSLLRRGQLRQLLAVLRDDDPNHFRQAIHDLLCEPGIRFHLQHLTLQFLGSLPDPTAPEVECVIELLKQEKTRLAVGSQVLYGRAPWFDAFDAKYVWKTWLASDEPWRVEIAARMLGSIVTQCGDRTAQLLLPYAEKPAPWPERIRFILLWNADQDTRPLFELRLRLLGNGHTASPESLFTENLARREPTWLVELLARLLSLGGRDIPDRSLDNLAQEPFSPDWLPHQAAIAVRIVAETAPASFWATITPLVVAAVAEHRTERRPWEHPVFDEDALWQREQWRHRHLGGEPLPALLALAGGHWARRDPSALLAAIAPMTGSPSKTIQQLVGTVWLHGPDSLADHAIVWLIEDDRRFCLGHLGMQGNWRLARDLILRFAPLCKDEVYQQLEAALMRGDPAREREHFKSWLREHVIGRSRVGFLRHALLPALPEARRSPSVKNAIGQLWEKFGRHAEEIEPETTVRGGLVISPIAGRSARLSDRAWLRLIKSTDRRSHAPPRYQRTSVIESSPESFARDLWRQAELEPGRFANLALRVPPEASPQYWGALLHALTLSKPPDQADSSWQAVTDARCCEVLRRVGYSPDSGVAIAFAECVCARPEFSWPEDVASIICRIATEHPHPQADNAVILGEAADRLDVEAINTARGNAAQALATVLFQQNALSPAACATIEHLVADPVPGIRVAAIRAITPVLNFGRDQAVAWFLRACDGTLDEVLASQVAQRFMSYTISTHTLALNDILDRMCRSAHAAVTEAGARWTTLVWLYTDGRENCFQECAVGSSASRKGVADVLAGNAHDERVAGKCQAWLPRFLDDDDREVRASATRFLRTAPDIASEPAVALLRAFAASRAFLEYPHYLAWELQRYNGNLRPLAQVIFEACDRLSRPAADPRDRQADRMHAIGELSVFLLRLYGQLDPPNDDPLLRKECLDRWDRILQHGNYIPPQVASFLD